MEGEDGGDDSEFDSVTSSQNSLLKRCPFAEPKSDRTPILPVSPPTSPDSVDGDVFRTPPEEPSLFAASDFGVSFRVPASASAATQFATVNARVSGEKPASATAIGKIKVGETEPAGTAADGTTNDPTEAVPPISLKTVLEAIIRNSGMAEESDKCKKLTIVDILKMNGIQFPE